MEKKTNVMAIVSMILGILSLLLFWVNGWVGLFLAIGGLILSIIGKKQPEGKGMAIAGMVCSIVTIALWFIIVLVITIILHSL